jgi:hypothetical protein
VARFPKGFVKPTDSCPSCLAWGNFRGRLCHTCYMFGRTHETSDCSGCGRRQPLKCDYCRLCWCRARLSTKIATGRSRVDTEVREMG